MLRNARVFHVFLSFVLVMALFACARGEESIRIEVDQATIEDDFILGEFTIEDIQLIVINIDGSEKRVAVDSSMISASDYEKLSTVGEHTITVSYRGESVSFTVNIVTATIAKIQAIYQLTIEANAFDGTYDEWLETVRGPRGEDGREVVLRVSGDNIQWQYVGDSEWTNLIELASLVGPKGDQGEAGGDGREIHLQVSDTHIQWQRTGDDTWTNLIGLDLLTGPKGPKGDTGDAGQDGSDGVDGRGVYFQVSDGYIQWQYDGESEWTNIIELASLIGPKGDTGDAGEDGVDGREVILQVSDTHIQWKHVGDDTWTNLISLDLLIGPKGPKGDTGDAGQDGTDGVDGREVCFQVSDGYIQWQYAGDSEWINLIELASLVGPKGDQGEAGSDGREIHLQVSDTHIQWQRTGDDNWQDLISLSLLIGPKGEQGEAGQDGLDGADGREVHFQVSNGYIQWQYAGDTEWINLIELASLIGPKGDTGDAGEDGVDGREVILQVSDTHIQWKHVGDDTWTDLISLDLLIGPKGTKGDTGDAGQDGTDGVDGREVYFQVSDGYIQWRYTGDSEWSNLIELATLTGPTGDQGRGIVSTEINELGELLVHYSDGTEVNLGTILRYHTVRFIDYNDSVIDVQFIRHGQDAEAPAVPFHEGKTFTGWSGDWTNITSNKEIRAEYDVKTYTVTFEPNGGDPIASIEGVMHGATIELPIPERSARGFLGWYLGESPNAAQFYETSEVTGDMTLYARWEYKEHLLRFTILPRIYEDGYGKQLRPGETAVSVFLAMFHGGAITSEGRLLTWGLNSAGQLGDGTNTNRNVPTDITHHFDLQEGEAIIHAASSYAHSVVLTSSGRVFMWGGNLQGQLGDGTSTNRNIPIDITHRFALNPDETIIRVDVGGRHSAALTSAGRLFMWGGNSEGQLGDGTTSPRSVPTDITENFVLNEGEAIVFITLGSYASAAQTSDGRIFTWGFNEYGQLGNNTTTDQLLPVDITANFGLDVGETVVDLALGAYHAGAVSSEGRVFTWGWNIYSQLGDGTTDNKLIPYDVTSVFDLGDEETIDRIRPGNWHTSALTSEGHVLVWGRVLIGINADHLDIVNPIEVGANIDLDDDDVFIDFAVSGSAFGDNTALLTSQGHLLTWGLNTYGQLGDGTNINSGKARFVFALTDTREAAYYNTGDLVNVYSATKDNHYLKAWYTDSTLTTPFEIDDEFVMLPQDVTLYGLWLPETIGIITSIPYHNAFFMQNDEAVYVVSGLGEDLVRTLEIGDKVRVFGREVIQSHIPHIRMSVFDEVISQGNPLPAPIELDGVDLTDLDTMMPYLGHRVNLNGFVITSITLLDPWFTGIDDIQIRLTSPFTDQEIFMFYHGLLRNDDDAEALLMYEVGDIVDLEGIVLRWVPTSGGYAQLLFSRIDEVNDSALSYDFLQDLFVEVDDPLHLAIDEEHQIDWFIDHHRWNEAIFMTSNDAVATVDENGVVKGVGSGEAKIVVAMKIDPDARINFTVIVP